MQEYTEWWECIGPQTINVDPDEEDDIVEHTGLLDQYGNSITRTIVNVKQPVGFHNPLST